MPRRSEVKAEIYMSLSVLTAHQKFKRNENDLHFDLQINFSQAVFGDKVEIPTLYGPVHLKIRKAFNQEVL